ncbi:50S ribosomal protein L11 methyltransferase [Ferruginibacter sp.]
MRYTEVRFSGVSAEQNDILIAKLADTGYEGFEENGQNLSAFIDEEQFDKTLLDGIAGDAGLAYTTSSIEQQNWNAQWESSFEPVVINDFATVRAAFHAPATQVQYEIIITPKMSFGTGHHATTFLMIEQMSRLDLKGKSVFDFGTGTGVLAILAHKMGAADIVAIDNDEWSIDNTKENIATNNAQEIVVQKADTVDTGRKYDIILANINLNVLVASMAAIAAVSYPHTQILLSGVLSTDEAAIKASLVANGLVFKELKEKNNWLCIRASAS